MTQGDRLPAEARSGPAEQAAAELDAAVRAELRRRREQMATGETELITWDDVRAALLSK